MGGHLPPRAHYFGGATSLAIQTFAHFQSYEDVISINCSRGSRRNDPQCSPKEITRESARDLMKNRRELVVKGGNLGNMEDQQFYVGGDYAVSRSWTTPSATEKCCNPLFNTLVHGHGDILCLCEANGFGVNAPTRKRVGRYAIFKRVVRHR